MSKDTALLVIDAQIGVVGEAYHRDEVLDAINLLLDRARTNNTPVIYVQHNGRKGYDMEPGQPAWFIHPAIAPHAGEPVVQKEAPDSFYKTHLQAELEARGIKHLIITGGQTQYCVDTTVRSAVAHGYDVLLASDAHTTDDSETLPAEKIIAFYNETLNGFWAGEHRVQVKPASEIGFTE
ncbi:cysteine hydrolase family protein [Tengunoibacter tsumagoiensis]|uniref:Isochorismatase n=1 Tax=Tengunoibacter tsumagoiensis TaxID=2014871 RepID=A0A402A944_9CHLR|nr:cysteine hydrolase family protein [Tengunoibacter tsumagoiensis]GCE15682.1 isochorismatase [Tengunoibacter tsumagoiensis]